MYQLIKINNIIKITLLLLGALFFSIPSHSLESEWIHSDKSKVRLISSQSASNNNQILILGLEYKLEPGWKTYWKSPGGGGFSQNINWNESTNIKKIDIEWPRPKEFEILGLTSIGYEDKVIFPLIITLEDKSEKTYVNINTNYLVCKNICIPGNANLYLEIPSGKGDFTEHFYNLEKIRSSISLNDLKLSSISNYNISAEKNKKEVKLNIKLETEKNFTNPDIFIHTPFGLPVVKPVNDLSLDLKNIQSTFHFDKNQFNNDQFIIEVYVYDENHNFEIIESISLEETSISFTDNKSIFAMLLIALLGGLILNLMPCVFPVLSIKLLSVLNSQSHNVRLSFIFTAFGIIFSFVLLALFFVSLKYLNYSIAWGMQFQQPYFLLFILLVLTFFCLNTLGFFYIELPVFLKTSKLFNQGNNIFTKNFFNGFFATLLATPCSAPLIGTAVTFAFTQNYLLLLLIFLFMGIGMSLPYILIASFPKTVLFLPKSGKWTNNFKYFLSILLFLTIIWLINIILNYYNLYFVLIFILLIIFAYISYKINYFRFATLSLSLVIFFSLPSINLFHQKNIISSNNNWLDFNEINITDLIDNNIIFVDITADWCATCQFNKVNVINTKNIENIFKDNQIILIRGDWTKPNKMIDSYLKKYNRYGIPFNAFFSNKFQDGILLSEILTEKEIIKAIEKLNE